jgi:hypothetical protein
VTEDHLERFLSRCFEALRWDGVDETLMVDVPFMKHLLRTLRGRSRSCGLALRGPDDRKGERRQLGRAARSWMGLGLKHVLGLNTPVS